jgi:REP element-mobilizing transposase RayT
MANTFTQLHIHIVFAVKGRENLISESNRIELESYICGIIKNRHCKTLAIYCNPDHTHILIGFHPTVSVSDLTRDIKSNSSRFINEKKWIRGIFRWQDGFGAFAYSKSQVENVINYILNQPNHHKRKSFQEEYIEILKKMNIEFDSKYLFEWNK